MKFRLMLLLVAVTFIAVAAMTPTPVSASQTCQVASLATSPMSVANSPAGDVENPCDPTPAILLGCKAMHGHFKTSCCCCVTH